jgi:hypothetical protein
MLGSFVKPGSIVLLFYVKNTKPREYQLCTVRIACINRADWAVHLHRIIIANQQARRQPLFTPHLKEIAR